jgi:biopolymer transport protein ExbB
MEARIDAVWRRTRAAGAGAVVLSVLAMVGRAEASAPVFERGNLPRDLSPWGMFLAADVVVQGVMIGLVIASVAVWTVWVAKSVELWAAKRSLRRDLAAIALQQSLDEAVERVAVRRGLAVAFLDAARSELSLLAGSAQAMTGVKERVSSRLAEIETAAGRSMRGGTGVLATVGATAPFIGLFGTV